MQEDNVTKRKRKPRKADGVDDSGEPVVPPPPLLPFALSTPIGSGSGSGAAAASTTNSSSISSSSTTTTTNSAVAAAVETPSSSSSSSSSSSQLDLPTPPDPQTVNAVAELIATNRKLRRALKERDAERSSLQKELVQAAALAKEQSESLLALRHELELARKDNQMMFPTSHSSKLRRTSSLTSSDGGGDGGGGSLGRGSSAESADTAHAGGGGGGRHGGRKGKRKVRHPLNPELSVVDPSTGTLTRGLMQRQASLGTSEVLAKLPHLEKDALAQKFVDLYKDPSAGVEYMESDTFAEDIMALCGRAKRIFEDESRCLFLESPCYVFGDTHGNLEDLHFFSDNLWRLGVNLCAGRFLFLGDYVDRGMSSLEVVTYLIALKTLHRDKVFMLRGNHETRDVNGWEEHYGDRSFLAQCKNRFGDDLGWDVWEELNSVFDRLPLAAVIDRDIFCIHGGIPRPLPGAATGASRLEMIQRIPAVSGINPPFEHEDEHLRQMASECIWSDPAGEDQEESGELSAADGYGESPRGGGTICFGNKALDDFLSQHSLSYVMRAHEAHAYGVSLSKRARCFTVFSTSKDHNQGGSAVCGCILVDFQRMEVITRSPHYRNQYVHRRDSMSIQSLNSEEFEARSRVGLIRDDEDDSDEDDDEDDYDDYDEDEYDDDEDDYDDTEEQDEDEDLTQVDVDDNDDELTGGGGGFTDGYSSRQRHGGKGMMGGGQQGRLSPQLGGAQEEIDMSHLAGVGSAM